MTVSLMPLRQWGSRGIDVAGIAACATVAAIFYLSAIGPLLRQRSATAELRREIQTQQEKTADLQAAMATARQRLAAVRQELEINPLQLDSAAHINMRIARLTEFFTGCDLHIDSVQTGQTTGGLQYDSVLITIIGRGAYQQCVQLLHGLRSTFPDMGVIRVELAGNPATSTELEKCRFDLLWYAAPGQTARRVASDGT